MAGNIKGITIRFDGDTTSLEKALKKVKYETKGIDQQLKDVNRALKFNPRNTELLAQKQALLKQKIDTTERSLKDLKQAQADLDAKGVDKSSKEYMELRREIIAAESKVKNFKAQLAQTAAQASKLYRVGNSIKDIGAKAKSAGQAMRGLSVAAAGVTTAIAGAAYKAGQMADDLNTLSKQTGISTEDLQLYAAAADLTDVSVEAMAKTHQKLKKNMLGAQDGTNDQAQYFQQLGIDITNADGSLRDANEVFDETIKALGKMENETERDAIAMAIFGKSANELNPIIEDGGATYEKVSKIMSKYGLEPVSQDALDKANEFNDKVDTIKLVFTQAVQIIGTKIASYLLPLMTKITDVAGKIAEKVAKLNGGVLTRLAGVSAAVAALSPVLIVLGTVMDKVGDKMKDLAGFVSRAATKFPKFGKALRFITNPVALVVAALAGLGLAVGKSGKSAEELVKIFDTMVKKAVVKVKELIPKIVEILKNIGATIVKNAPIILQGLSTLLQAVLQAVIKYAPVLLQGAVKLFSSLVQSIPVILPKLLAAITGLIGAVLKKLPTFIPLILKAAVTTFMAIVKAIPQVVTALAAALPAIGKAALNYFKGLRTSIHNVFKNIGSWFATKFGSAWKSIKSAFTGWGEFWSGLWTKIKDKFKSIGSNISIAISTSIKGGLNKLLSALESKLNHVVVTINKIIMGINKYTPLNIGTIGAVQLPRLAKGGVLNGAQTVIAGEAGPEAIIPLDKLFAQMDKMADRMAESNAPAGSPVNIYINAPDGKSAREIANEVKRLLITEAKGRRTAWA